MLDPLLNEGFIILILLIILCNVRASTLFLPSPQPASLGSLDRIWPSQPQTLHFHLLLLQQRTAILKYMSFYLIHIGYLRCIWPKSLPFAFPLQLQM
jgi:hypothetical protein